MAEDQKKLQALSDEYQKLQNGKLHAILEIYPLLRNPPRADLQVNIDARQKLESQQQENKGVQKVEELYLPLSLTIKGSDIYGRSSPNSPTMQTSTNWSVQFY